jgi:hypothetical protein
MLKRLAGLLYKVTSRYLLVTGILAGSLAHRAIIEIL